MPKMVIPKAGEARARAVAGEEFDRMITAAPKIRPTDSEAWIFYLQGFAPGRFAVGREFDSVLG